MTSFLKSNYNLIFKKLNTMKTLRQQYQDLDNKIFELKQLLEDKKI